MKYTWTILIRKILKEQTVADIRSKVEEALKTEGFGVLTEIDIQATMKKKLDKDYLPHLYFGCLQSGVC